MYTVYILRCADGSLYTGVTTDVQRRFAQHLAGLASKYTRSRGVLRVVYTEKQRTKGLALRREAEIKRLTRAQKLLLVGGKCYRARLLIFISIYASFPEYFGE